MLINLMRVAAVLLVLLSSNSVHAHNFKSVIQKTSKSVCLIEAIHETLVIDSKGMEKLKNPFEEFLESDPNKEPQLNKQKTTIAGSGTCFIILYKKQKYLITNEHVINSATSDPSISLYVTFKGDLKQYVGKLVGVDKLSDLAVLKMVTTQGQHKIQSLPALHFTDSSKVEQGEEVFAIGHPIGQRWTITQGIVSAINRRLSNTWQEVIQSDVSINKGNSGGPLLNEKGQVIGVNSFILSPGGGAGSVGINFSVTSNQTVYIIKHLIENGSIRRGKLGLAFNIDKEHGVIVIERLESGGPMEVAGFKKGDVLQKINNVTINKPEDVGVSMDHVKPEQEVDIQVVRLMNNVGPVVILKTIVTTELDPTFKLD